MEVNLVSEPFALLYYCVSEENGIKGVTCSASVCWRSQNIQKVLFTSILFEDLIFQTSFRFTARLSRRSRDSLYTPYPHKCVASPFINIPHQRWYIWYCSEPTLIDENHPKSRVYIIVYSWCFTFCVFGRMYNDLYPPFHSLKILCAAPIYHSLSSGNPGNYWSFYYLHNFAFSRISYT